MEGSDQSDPRSALVVQFLAFVFGALLLYVLSIGPVVRVFESVNSLKTHSGMRFLETVYAPIIWLGRHTILGEPINRTCIFGVRIE